MTLTEDLKSDIKRGINNVPYCFVEWQRKAVIHGEPVYHDSFRSDDEFFSGEIRLRFTALSPLLAANYQFSLEDAEEDFAKRVNGEIERRLGAVPTKTAKKKVLQPLFAGAAEDSPVLIAGSALKGMLRNSLAALFSAPLERARERTLSFRPNASPPGKKEKDNYKERLETRELVVVAADENSLKVCWVVEKKKDQKPPNNVIYVDSSDAGNPASPDELAFGLEHEQQNIDEIKSRQVNGEPCYSDENGFKTKSFSRGKVTVAGKVDGYHAVRYAGSIDGDGILADAFMQSNAKSGSGGKKWRGYKKVWAKIDFSETYTIEGDDLEKFRRTIQHLGDARGGHLENHPLVGKYIDKRGVENLQIRIEQFLDNRNLLGMLMFAEWDPDEKKIASLGHHYRYRQAYRDTIHTQKKDGQEKTGLRPIVCPTVHEMSGDNHLLTGVRLLTGYVSTSEGYKPAEPTTFGIGIKAKAELEYAPTVEYGESTKGDRTDESQLAGRFSFNMAVEWIGEGPRFVGTPDTNCLFLKPLGSPKPNPELYFRQQLLNASPTDKEWRRQRKDISPLKTPGDSHNDESAQLNGRKFYRHQPPLARKPDQMEIRRARPGSDEANMLDSEQSSIARFTSAPGTTFGVSLRVTNMRHWELGAILFTLSPQIADLKRFNDKIDENKSKKRLASVLKRFEQQETADGSPLFAHKLGHGRPLGMGSVEWNIEAIRKLVETGTQWSFDEKPAMARDDFVDSFFDYVISQSEKPHDEGGIELRLWIGVLAKWLDAHRYAGNGTYRYPDDTGSRDNIPKVFNYHSNVRNAHIKARKLAPK